MSFVILAFGPRPPGPLLTNIPVPVYPEVNNVCELGPGVFQNECDIDIHGEEVLTKKLFINFVLLKALIN